MLKCWCVENALLSPEPWIWTSWVLVIGLEDVGCWVHTLIVLKPRVLSKKWTWWKEKRKKEDEDAWDDFVDEKLSLKWKDGCRWDEKVVADDFDVEKMVAEEPDVEKMIAEKLVVEKLVVCSLCDEVEWSKSKKEENV
jgi:hypothetical protein